MNRGRTGYRLEVSTLASFLHPEGFTRPPLGAVLRESSVVGESGRYLVRTVADRRDRRSPDPRPRWRGSSTRWCWSPASWPVTGH